jgi:SRSO17 transposase
VENSQVAVFGALCAGGQATLIDAELYLPECRINDRRHCEKIHIPPERMKHKSKLELALEIVFRQRNAGIRFAYVCADGLYGNSFDFCRKLDDANEKFLVHIHSNLKVFTKNPQMGPAAESVRVDEIARQVQDRSYERVIVRDSTRGKLLVDAWRKEVWLPDESSSGYRSWILFVRRDVDGEIKYCLSNLSMKIPLRQMALMESQRFWIERSFENGKSEVGMADYQVRTWQGWHHHMALVMLAMLFMMKQRMICRDSAPLLSCRDIRVMLEHFLPKKAVSAHEVIEQINARHRRRKKAIISKAKMQAQRLGNFP